MSLRRTDCLLTKKFSFFSGFRRSVRVLDFPFVFIGLFLFLSISCHIPYPSLFVSFIPSSAFVFSYLVIPSLRHMAPGAYDLQYVTSYLFESLFHYLFYSALYFSQFRFSQCFYSIDSPCSNNASAVDHSVLSPPILSTKRISEMHIHVHVQ